MQKGENKQSIKVAENASEESTSSFEDLKTPTNKQTSEK